MRVGPVKNRPHPIQNDSDPGALALADLRTAGYPARSITTPWQNELFPGGGYFSGFVVLKGGMARPGRPERIPGAKGAGVLEGGPAGLGISAGTGAGGGNGMVGAKGAGVVAMGLAPGTGAKGAKAGGGLIGVGNGVGKGVTAGTGISGGLGLGASAEGVVGMGGGSTSTPDSVGNPPKGPGL